MAPAMGLSASPGPLTPPFLRASVIAHIPLPVPVSLTAPQFPCYIPSHTHTHTHTPLCFPGLFAPLTLTTFFFFLIFFIIAFLPLLQSSLHEARKIYFVHPQPLEQYVTHRKEKVKMLVTHSCPTLCNPMDYSLPCSSVCEILQARILEWIVIPFSWGSSQPRDRTLVSCTAGRFFTPEPSGKPWNIGVAW